jgi:membrane-bound lytic murein transglycosylase F
MRLARTVLGPYVTALFGVFCVLLILSVSFLPAFEGNSYLHAQWRPTQMEPITTLDKILATGQLTILTQNNANSYFIYREDQMGFEYDLAHAFASRLGVDLQVKTPGWSQLIPLLQKNKGDIIAAGMTITEHREQLIDFSIPYMDVQQMIIVHKKMSSLQDMEDLSGITLHVRKHTSYQERLNELEAQGYDLNIQLYKNIPTEEFIRLVAEQNIDATVADSNIAQLNRRYYPDIHIAFPISEKQSLGWGVRTSDHTLLQAVNDFLRTAQEDGTFARIYQKYYAPAAIFDYVDIKKFHQRIQVRLPKYEAIIREEAQQFGFDWRLIAAVIYQESHFDPHATSYTGVRGLMQVTQNTAREMGIANRLNPQQSIHAGVKYLYRQYQRFEHMRNHEQRIRFALASYNIGYGHVRDAQRLAQKQGLNPDIWSSMQKTLPLLRKPKYYTQTRYGYARGTEPVRYVKRVFSYYDILRQKAEVEKAEAALSSAGKTMVQQ